MYTCGKKAINNEDQIQGQKMAEEEFINYCENILLGNNEKGHFIKLSPHIYHKSGCFE